MFRPFLFRTGSALCASVIFSHPVSGQELGGGTDDLDSLLTAIGGTDAPIEAARLRWQAAQDEIPTTGTLPDPIRADSVNFALSTGTPGMQMAVNAELEAVPEQHGIFVGMIEPSMDGEDRVDSSFKRTARPSRRPSHSTSNPERRGPELSRHEDYIHRGIFRDRRV